jgi:plastocyanin
MRRATPILSLLLTVGLLALAGCGGGGSGSSSTTSAPASTTSGSGSTPSAAGPVAVAMKDIAFAPASVTVKVGQKITWTNDDAVEHNVTSQSGEKISSPNFGKGATFSFTPTKAGTIDYVCTIHPGMNGKIVVTQ